MLVKKYRPDLLAKRLAKQLEKEINKRILLIKKNKQKQQELIEKLLWFDPINLGKN